MAEEDKKKKPEPLGGRLIPDAHLPGTALSDNPERRDAQRRNFQQRADRALLVREFRKRRRAKDFAGAQQIVDEGRRRGLTIRGIARHDEIVGNNARQAQVNADRAKAVQEAAVVKENGNQKPGDRPEDKGQQAPAAEQAQAAQENGGLDPNQDNPEVSLAEQQAASTQVEQLKDAPIAGDPFAGTEDQGAGKGDTPEFTTPEIDNPNQSSVQKVADIPDAQPAAVPQRAQQVIEQNRKRVQGEPAKDAPKVTGVRFDPRTRRFERFDATGTKGFVPRTEYEAVEQHLEQEAFNKEMKESRRAKRAREQQKRSEVVASYYRRQGRYHPIYNA